MVGLPHTIPLELVGSILEMADVAWSAVEYRRERKAEGVEEDEIAQLRSENDRLRSALSENLALLQNVYKSPAFADDCPHDLYNRLVSVVENPSFLTKLETLNQEPKDVPNFEASKTEIKGTDLKCIEVSVGVDSGESSLWVWVTNEMTLDPLEEVSGIDNDSYVVISEENVLDCVSHFIASCILQNPKSKDLTPEELQKAMTKTLDVMKEKWKYKDVWESGKFLYTLSTWGIAFAGLYRHRAIVKVAAKGAIKSASLVGKLL